VSLLAHPRGSAHEEGTFISGGTVVGLRGWARPPFLVKVWKERGNGLLLPRKERKQNRDHSKAEVVGTDILREEGIAR